MNMKDIFAHVKPAFLLNPGTYNTTAGALAASSAIDLQGYKSCLLLLYAGAGGITFDTNDAIDIALQDSPDNSTFTNVDITKIRGVSDAALTNGIFKLWNAAKASATLQTFAYVGGARYIQPVVTFTGTHATGTALSLYALLSDPAYQPPVATISVAN